MKRKKTTRKPTPQVTSAPQPYMTPIFIPPQPVQIVRQRIQNQAAIQEQLRAYDKQQQDLVGANAAAFDANNIGRKTALYAEPVYAEPFLTAEDKAARAAKQRRQEAQEQAEQQQAQEKEEEEEERKVAEEREFQRKVELSRKPVDPAKMGLAPPPRKRGRPAAGAKTKGDRKLKEDLKADIRAAGTGSLPENFDELYYGSIQKIAQERGISIVYE